MTGEEQQALRLRGACCRYGRACRTAAMKVMEIQQVASHAVGPGFGFSPDRDFRRRRYPGVRGLRSADRACGCAAPSRESAIRASPARGRRPGRPGRVLPLAGGIFGP